MNVGFRYPTFNDALHDLDDCLSLCFFYSSLPRSTKVPVPLISLCRRLTVEFMHYIISARALRKVFISVKGIYYQVEIKGKTVTWLTNHQRGFQPTSAADVDYRIMTNFVDFYTTMLGFVNFRLYHSLNLHYPPKLPGVSRELRSLVHLLREKYDGDFLFLSYFQSMKRPMMTPPKRNTTSSWQLSMQVWSPRYQPPRTRLSSTNFLR